MSNKPIIPTVVNYDFASLYPNTIRTIIIKNMERKCKIRKIFKSETKSL